MQYYTDITMDLSVDNVDQLPLLLMMKWFEQKPSVVAHLRVIHPNGVGDKWTRNLRSNFFDILWDDAICPQNTSFKIIRLRLEGNTEGVGKTYAILEMRKYPTPGTYTPQKIRFSPVEFGPNGRPRLHKMPKQFIAASKLVLEGKVPSFDEAYLHMELAQSGIEISEMVIPGYFKCMKELALIENGIPGSEIKRLMTFDDFKNIFGI